MQPAFALSPHLQTLASSLLQRALNGERTTGKPVKAKPRRKYKKRRPPDGAPSLATPFNVAVREIAVVSGVPPDQWLNKKHPLNEKLYLRMAELAGVSPTRRPAQSRAMPTMHRSISP